MRPPRKADLVTAALTLLLATVGLTVTARAAQAAPTCWPNNGDASFDGFWHNDDVWPQHQWEGASAYIKVWYPGACSGGFRPYTGAWVMIAQSSVRTSLVGYSQAGYVRDVDPTGLTHFRTFGEFADDVNDDGRIDTANHLEWKRVYWQDAITGTRPAYRVLWNPSTGRFDASYNGTVFSSSHFNPYSAGWQQPFSPQFMGETKYQTGNMPGSTSMPTSFTAIGAQRATDHTLVSMSCSMFAVNENTALWGLKALSCNAFDIWQK